MRRWTHLLSASLLALNAAALVAQDTTDANGYELKGVVVSTDGAIVKRVQVSVVGVVDATTVTNDSGKFNIDRLPRGTRVVEFRAIGYEPRYLPVGIGPNMSVLSVTITRITMLDSVRIVAVNRSEFARRTDILGEKELSAPDIIGGSALNAVALLRPQMLRARGPTSFTASNESAERGQLFYREKGDSVVGKVSTAPKELAELTTGAGSLSVSVNEGPPGSPDILSVIPARRIREIRLLRPLEATARFGPNAGAGPVLLIYTK